MARIRSVKPEFWDDETIGLLSRDARLLYIATWNMADDEGLLRWTPSYIKASAFMYDDDLGPEHIVRLMGELVEAGLIFPYIGGKANQRLAWVVMFGKHQKPNRPQPSKLPPPSVQSTQVLAAYVRRDHATCHLCGHPTNAECLPGPIDPYSPTEGPSREPLNPSLDHLTPRSQGGSDYPSNLALSHIGCNKSRADGPVEEFRIPVSVASLLGVAHGSVTSSRNGSVNGSVTSSPPEGRGEEKEGNGRGKPRPAAEPPREDVLTICRALADATESNTHKRPRISESWLRSARLLLDTDGRTVADVLAVIDFVRRDDFESGVVQAMPKLRDRFGQLYVKAKNRRPTGQQLGLGYSTTVDHGPSRAYESADDWINESRSGA